jgi:hypothetical protein
MWQTERTAVRIAAQSRIDATPPVLETIEFERLNGALPP